MILSRKLLHQSIVGTGGSPLPQQVQASRLYLRRSDDKSLLRDERLDDQAAGMAADRDRAVRPGAKELDAGDHVRVRLIFRRALPLTTRIPGEENLPFPP